MYCDLWWQYIKVRKLFGEIRYSGTNLHKTWNLCEIIFVILTCFYLTKKISVLTFKNKVADEKMLVEIIKSLSAILFLEDRTLNFSSPKNFITWKQVKITNLILQRQISHFYVKIAKLQKISKEQDSFDFLKYLGYITLW